MVHNGEEIVHTFFQYFKSVTTKLENRHSAINNLNNHNAYLSNTFFMMPIEASEIQNIIKTIPSQKSCGIDEITIKALKSCALP